MTESVWRISKDEAVGEHGMIVTRDPRATRVGLDVLRRGGNAVDAAVTAAFALAVVEPMSSGIGGGGVMVVHDPKRGGTSVIDYAMDAPLAAGPDVFELEEGTGSSAYGWRKVKDEANVSGHRSVSVPGMVRGLALALERFGTAPLRETLAPAIAFAEKGTEVTTTLAFRIAMGMPVLSRFPATAAIFLPGGFPLRHGGGYGPTDRLLQPDLGRTLRRIADDGPDALYRGEVARRIVGHLGEHGGLVTEEDLARYRPAVIDGGLQSTYRGCTIVGAPGAAGSITTQQGLAILDGFDLPSLGADTVASLHLEAEAFRLAFADRYRYAGDPKQVPVPWHGLLSDAYAAARRAEINPARAAGDIVPGDPFTYDRRERAPGLTVAVPVGAHAGGSTTHLCVVDRDRTVVALTQTLVNNFGSGVVVPGTGVLLNNAMSWFDPEPGRVNSAAPGRRGLHNMAPTIVLRDGRPLMAIGAAGGRRIIQAVGHIIRNVLDHGLGIQDAIAGPRIDCSVDRLLVDTRFGVSVIDGLRRLGHRVDVAEQSLFTYPFATPLGVFVDPETGAVHGGVDPYQVAMAAGY
jgi:gamma-glutamyltranspeptidase/glutathione hydrolase